MTRRPQSPPPGLGPAKCPSPPPPHPYETAEAYEARTGVRPEPRVNISRVEFDAIVAAKDEEISRLNELLSVFQAWKDGIESSGDADGWATAHTWKQTQMKAEADRDRLAAEVAELRGAIAHQRKVCQQSCDSSDCDAWKDRGRRCPTCPLEWADELDAALAARK